MPRFCHEPGQLPFAAHLSANPFVDTMMADKPKGGTYKQVGDYLLPEIEVPENPEVGFWGMQRRKYLLEHQSALYTALFLGGKLADHLQEIDRSATRMFDQLVDQLKIRNGVTEQLKAADQMKWVRRMNAVRYEAAEIVAKELIYDEAT